MECYYYKSICKKKRDYSEFDYINYGWQRVLTARERLVLFYTIPFIENKRGFNPGSRLYVSCRELEEVSGIDKRYFSHRKDKRNILDRLNSYGLLEFIPGKRHIWYKSAGIIKRIIPIPVVSKCLQGNVEMSTHYIDYRR